MLCYIWKKPFYKMSSRNESSGLCIGPGCHQYLKMDPSDESSDTRMLHEPGPVLPYLHETVKDADESDYVDDEQIYIVINSVQQRQRISDSFVDDVTDVYSRMGHFIHSRIYYH